MLEILHGAIEKTTTVNHCDSCRKDAVTVFIRIFNGQKRIFPDMSLIFSAQRLIRIVTKI